jgi:hypothetical protein
LSGQAHLRQVSFNHDIYFKLIKLQVNLNVAGISRRREIKYMNFQAFSRLPLDIYIGILLTAGFELNSRGPITTNHFARGGPPVMCIVLGV